MNRAKGRIAGMKRDHGGDLDAARARFGGDDWIDLSTGINRNPWPVPPLSAQSWTALPGVQAESRLIREAASWFGCPPDHVLPMAGATAAIQAMPRLDRPGRAAVLWPSYNEHGASLIAAGWQVTRLADPQRMEGADLAVVVNPNNPDGREWPPEALARLAAKVGRLIVDESFADPRPDLSLACAIPENTVILRSFGKFWGLAGLRVGFARARPETLAALREIAGPWSVSGPALEIGAMAMADRAFADETIVYHSEAGLWLDIQAARAGWDCVGGTHLFRLYATPDARAAQDRLAGARIWSRRFPWSDRWLRLGIPGTREERDRVADALRG